MSSIYADWCALRGIARAVIIIGKRARSTPRCTLGEIPVWSTPQPLLSSVGVLHARCLTGDPELWDEIRSFRSLMATTEATAGLTVHENRKLSPRLVRYRPFVLSRSAAQRLLSQTPSICTGNPSRPKFGSTVPRQSQTRRVPVLSRQPHTLACSTTRILESGAVFDLRNQICPV